MKTLVTLLLLTVICFQCYYCTAPLAPQALFKQCCPDTTQTPIPKGRVEHVEAPHSACQVKAVIVTTVCKKKICIDANWKWSKKLLAEFKKSTANNKTAPSAPFNLKKCEDVKA